MDIDLLAKMVNELILKQDEVLVPGLGVFVAEEADSVFSDKGFTINPPYRRLALRQNESTDNSLVELYAKYNSVGYEEAEKIIVAFVEKLVAELKEKKSLELPGLGRFRATKQNNFFFVQAENVDIFPDGFGLESVSLKSIPATRGASVLKHVKEFADEIPLKQTVEEPVEEAVDETVVEPVAETIAEPVVESVMEPVVEPEPAPVEAGQQPSVSEEPQPVPFETVKVKKRRGWLVALLIVIAAAILFFAAIAILGRVAPQLIDPYLYSPEELQLLK